MLALGEPLYRSRIEEAVTDVPGMLGVHDLLMSWRATPIFGVRTTSPGPRFSPGPGGFFTLQQTDLQLCQAVESDD